MVSVKLDMRKPCLEDPSDKPKKQNLVLFEKMRLRPSCEKHTLINANFTVNNATFLYNYVQCVSSLEHKQHKQVAFDVLFD